MIVFLVHQSIIIMDIVVNGVDFDASMDEDYDAIYGKDSYVITHKIKDIERCESNVLFLFEQPY